MGGEQIDALARLLAAGTQRRKVIGALAAGLAVPFLGRFRNEAKAACKKPGQKCKTKKGKKNCCGDAKCRGNRCKCLNGRVKCGKKCCPKGDICTGGSNCVVGQGSCPAGHDTCASGTFQVCQNDVNCACLQRLQGGTRCGQITEVSEPDQCTNDDDCLALGLPNGSSCVNDDGSCEGTNPERGLCVAPCGSVPPPPIRV